MTLRRCKVLAGRDVTRYVATVWLVVQDGKLYRRYRQGVDWSCELAPEHATTLRGWGSLDGPAYVYGGWAIPLRTLARLGLKLTADMVA